MTGYSQTFDARQQAELNSAFAAAVSAHQAGELERAVNGYRRLLEHLPDHPELHERLGIALQQRDAGEQAIGHLRRARELDPDNPAYRVNLALALDSQGDYHLALEESQKALERWPEHPALWFNAGTELRMLDRYGEAVSAFSEVLELTPDNIGALVNRAVCLHRLEKDDQAASDFEKALAAQPRDPRVLNNFANFLQDTGNPERARQLLEEAVRMAPDNEEARGNLAVVMMQAGDFASAAACLRQAGETARPAIDHLAWQAVSGVETHAGFADDLLDFDRLVMELRPFGATSDEACNELNRALSGFVCDHPTRRYEPASKTTRHGYQTLNLVRESNSAIRQLVDSIRHAVDTYLASHPVDARHPWLRWRPQRWSLNVWATILERGGHQNPHIHPGGYLSGVYYAQVPEQTEPQDAEAGWIEFGTPPAEFPCMERHPSRRYAPEEGRLLLFPSYLFHHTVPFEGEDFRISIAFDVVPED